MLLCGAASSPVWALGHSGLLTNAEQGSIPRQLCKYGRLLVKLKCPSVYKSYVCEPPKEDEKSFEIIQCL